MIRLAGHSTGGLLCLGRCSRPRLIAACAAEPGTPGSPQAVHRRTALGLLALPSIAVALSTGGVARAEGTAPLVPGTVEDIVDTTSTQYVYNFVSDVLPNLRVKEYQTIIANTRRRCWADIAQCIQTKQYAKLALQPTQNSSHLDWLAFEMTLPLNWAPFSDLRAAALYCSWALLQADDYAAATECRRAYKDFDVHVQDLQQIAEAASLDGANPEQVQQSFILLNASLEKLLSTIPVKYLS